MVPAASRSSSACRARPTLRPAGHGYRDETARGACLQEAEADRRSMTPPHLVGHERIAQVGAAVEKIDVDVAAPEGAVVQHGLEQVAVGLETVELEGSQGERQLPDRGGSVFAMCHQLRHKRVVDRTDHAARLDRAAVDANARTLGPRTCAAVPGVGRYPSRGLSAPNRTSIAWPLLVTAS